MCMLLAGSWIHVLTSWCRTVWLRCLICAWVASVRDWFIDWLIHSLIYTEFGYLLSGCCRRSVGLVCRFVRSSQGSPGQERRHPQLLHVGGSDHRGPGHPDSAWYLWQMDVCCCYQWWMSCLLYATERVCGCVRAYVRYFVCVRMCVCVCVCVCSARFHCKAAVRFDHLFPHEYAHKNQCRHLAGCTPWNNTHKNRVNIQASPQPERTMQTKTSGYTKDRL